MVTPDRFPALPAMPLPKATEEAPWNIFYGSEDGASRPASAVEDAVAAAASAAEARRAAQRVERWTVPRVNTVKPAVTPAKGP